MSRRPSLEDQAHDAAMFAQVAQFMVDDLLGMERGKPGSMVEMTAWEADLLIFAVHQAKFAAEAVHEALPAYGIVPLATGGPDRVQS